MYSSGWQDFLYETANDYDLGRRQRRILHALFPTFEGKKEKLSNVAEEIGISHKNLKTSEDLSDLYEKFTYPDPSLQVNPCEELKKPSGDRAKILFEWLRKEYRRTTDTPQELTVSNIVDLLADLDYKPQYESFERRSRQKSSAISLWICAEEDEVQRWIISRLIPAISGFKRGQEVVLDLREAIARERGFWEMLGKELELGESATRESVLSQLLKGIRSRKIVIILKSLERLNSDCQEKFYGYWLELIEQIGAYEPDLYSRGLVLLFIDKRIRNASLADSFVFQEEADNLACPRKVIRIDPLLEINADEIQWWMEVKHPEICERYLPNTKKLTPAGVIQYLRDIQSWKDSSPYFVLDQICRDLGFRGIEAIEANWSNVA